MTLNYRLGLISVAAALCALTFATAATAVETLRIGWSDLAQSPGREFDLAGKRIEMTGYLLPVDIEGGLVYEFLLVPWFGACSHTPPPPPSRVVRVTPERPYQLTEIRDPVTVSGTLKPGLEKTQLFIVDGVRVVESGYGVGRAQVRKTEAVPEEASKPGGSPWKFMK